MLAHVSLMIDSHLGLDYSFMVVTPVFVANADWIGALNCGPLRPVLLRSHGNEARG